MGSHHPSVHQSTRALCGSVRPISLSVAAYFGARSAPTFRGRSHHTTGVPPGAQPSPTALPLAHQLPAEEVESGQCSHLLPAKDPSSEELCSPREKIGEEGGGSGGIGGVADGKHR